MDAQCITPVTKRRPRPTVQSAEMSWSKEEELMKNVSSQIEKKTGKKWEDSFTVKINLRRPADGRSFPALRVFSCWLSDGIVFLPSFVIIYSISLADQIVFCNPISVVCVST